MNISATFIRRPVATTLLTVGMAMAGVIAFHFLPVSPLPKVDFPTIQVSANLPGADPEPPQQRQRRAPALDGVLEQKAGDQPAEDQPAPAPQPLSPS